MWIARTLRKPLRLFYLLFQLVLLSEKLLCLFFQVLKKTKQTKVSQKRTLRGISNKCINRKCSSPNPNWCLYLNLLDVSPLPHPLTALLSCWIFIGKLNARYHFIWEQSNNLSQFRSILCRSWLMQVLKKKNYLFNEIRNMLTAENQS